MAVLASHPARITVASMSALVVAMSISRFAYTPILPVMIDQGAVTHEFGAVLASVNLFGYLAGAVLASAAWARRSRVLVLKWSLIAIAGTLAMMAIPHAGALWTFSRFGSGVASALVFVLASSLVLDLHAAPYATALFSSVGAGIAITGVLVPIAYQAMPNWSAGWIATTLLAMLFSLVAFALLEETAPASRAAVHDLRAGMSPRLAAVTACYAVAGFSYVIPATFLVAIVASTPSLRAYAASTWTVVGFTACVTTFAWGPLAARFGKAPMLACALLLLAVGCVAPVSGEGAIGALIAAFGLGASFMAISMLTIGIVRDEDPVQTTRRIGIATAVFGIGQALGPAFTAAAYAVARSYAPAFVVAALVLVIAAICVAFAFRKEFVR